MLHCEQTMGKPLRSKEIYNSTCYSTNMSADLLLKNIWCISQIDPFQFHKTYVHADLSEIEMYILIYPIPLV